jgi:prepilin-type N-terminal cleavage/methylation domain-containing protein
VSLDRSAGVLAGIHEARAARAAALPAPLSQLRDASGFTLLEVLVALTVLAVGVALTLSLISGSLGNIRKAQLRTRTIEHAEAVMEQTLLDDSIQRPTTLVGNFEDGTRWTVRVEEYIPPSPVPQSLEAPSPQNMTVKLLSYVVEMFSPDSRSPDYHLQTLKLVKVPLEEQTTRLPQ